MKNQEILNSALKIIAQTPLTGDAEDYAERAPYLIASFCAEALELNNHLLAASGKTPFSRP